MIPEICSSMRVFARARKNTSFKHEGDDLAFVAATRIGPEDTVTWGGC